MVDNPQRHVTENEAWQISCHEAGHAIVAARLALPFQTVERGSGEHGQVVPAVNPIDEPDDEWTSDELVRWRKFYAGGAAAERLLFGRYRDYGAITDRRCHRTLEQRIEPGADCWESDIEAVIGLLTAADVERVGTELNKKSLLTFDDVFQLLGCEPPF